MTRTRTTPKVTVKVEKSKPRLKKKPKAVKPTLKKGRWSAISREIESYIKCHSDRFKIVRKDTRSYLVIKSVFTVEVRKNNNNIHQPYTQNVEAMQYKCFLIIDGAEHKHDEMTLEYSDFEIPIVYVIMPEEVKYKLSDYK